MKWNAGWIESQQCEKDAQKLGVKLTLNQRKAVNGFCVLWIKSPAQVKFESVENSSNK
jgi:hypothetical protein